MKGPSRLMLFVDDDQETRLLVREGLSDCQVLTAACATTSLAMARRIPVDVYLISARLPDLPADELCRAVRRFDRKTPIITCAPERREGERERMLAAGAQEHLVKPLDLAWLRSVIEAALNDRWIESMSARIAEHAAVLDELNVRSALVRARTDSSWQESERIRNRLLRIRAYRAYIDAGGARANFTRIWPDMAQAFGVSRR